MSETASYTATSKKPRMIQTSSAGRSLAALAVLLVPSVSRAFAPERGINGRDNPGGVAQIVGTVHTEMTATALRIVLKLDLGIDKPTVAHERAIRAIGLANMMVDENQLLGQLHVDGETFFLAHHRLQLLRTNVLDALQREDYTEARNRLGEALHTLQDFYSHSNWVDQEELGPHPQFGAVGAQLQLGYDEVAKRGDVTCQRCASNDCSKNIITSKLTSGYYEGSSGIESDAPPVKGVSKCNHGGVSDVAARNSPLTIFKEGINKDTEVPALSPHYHLHKQAVATATEATVEYVSSIAKLADPARFRSMFEISETLGIVVDRSSSMADVLDVLEDQAIQGVYQRREGQAYNNKLIFIGFNDPGTVDPKYAGTSYDAWVDTFRSAYRTFDGGDCEEASMEGTLEALWSSGPGGVIFLITDAGAKTPALKERIVEVATKRRVRVHPILLPGPAGSCQSYDQSVYLEIARRTGGVAHRLVERAAVDNLLAKFRDLSQPTGQLQTGTITGPVSKSGGAQPSFVVDGSVHAVSVVVSDTTDAQLVRPDGSVVPEGDAKVTRTDLGGALLFALRAPEAGRWGVRGTTGEVHVTSDSELAIVSFDFVDLRGREGHQGYFPIEGQPVIGQTYDVAVDLSLPVGAASVELRSPAGQVLVSSPLEARPGADGKPLNDGRYSGSFAVPGGSFVAYVVGKTLGGEEFERSAMQNMVAQNLHLSVPPQNEVFPGSQVDYPFEVRNAGPAGTFEVSVNDSTGFLVSGKQQTLVLAQGQTAQLKLTARAPAEARVGARGEISVTLTDSANPTLSTSGSVPLEVTENLDVDDDGALNGMDNCPTTANPDQLDWDRDRVGNACDATPGEAPPETGCAVKPVGAFSHASWPLGGVLVLGLAFAARRLRRRPNERGGR